MQFAGLNRERGAVLEFSLHSGPGGVGFINRPTLQQGGMIGGWAVTDNGFATLTNDGAFATLASTTSSLAGATSSSHVNIGSSTQTLAADTTIASLRSLGGQGTIDLNGHRLTIASGGMFDRPAFSNGTITAGSDGPAELIVHRSSGATFSASIVDNPNGAVSLVASDGYLRLTSANTYTGGTWVVGNEDPISSATGWGQLVIGNLAAIPQNDRVYVDGGIYNLQSLQSGVAKLAELHLRGGGRVASYAAQIDADHIVLEEGYLTADLTGDGQIIKRTDGVVDFSNNKSPGYTGMVAVREGRILLQKDTLPSAKFVLTGGEVRFNDDSAIANQFTLDGGAVNGGRLTGVIDVVSDSVLRHEASTVIAGTLRGAGDLIIRGRQDNRYTYQVSLLGNATQFTGDYHVESGALRVGAAGAVGAGVINVRDGGRLILLPNTSSSPTLSVANAVHLYGGTLVGRPQAAFAASNRVPSNILTGDLVVHGEGYIGATATGVSSGVSVPGLTLAGRVSLLDGAHAYGLSDTRSSVAVGAVALVDISGELVVGADATWHLLSSSLSLSGVVRPAAASGAIDFVGGADLLRLNGAEFRVAAGQSLAVKRNGGLTPMEIRGAGTTLAGMGEFVGSFNVLAGGAIAPGASAGVLIIKGDVVLGSGGVLDVEIGGRQLGAQYDQLNLLGDLHVGGGVLDISFLNSFLPIPSDVFTVAKVTEGTMTGAFANVANGQRVAINNGAASFRVNFGPGSPFNQDELILSGFQLALSGDFDVNGKVDGNDFLTWQRGGSPNPGSGADLAAWRANFGASLGLAAGAPVPEPRAEWLASCLTLLSLLYRRHHVSVSPRRIRVASDL